MKQVHIYKDRVPSVGERLSNVLIFGAVSVVVLVLGWRLASTQTSPIKSEGSL